MADLQVLGPYNGKINIDPIIGNEFHELTQIFKIFVLVNDMLPKRDNNGFGKGTDFFRELSVPFCHPLLCFGHIITAIFR
jgi:hypothetical protein